MTDYKALADRLVELGILIADGPKGDVLYYPGCWDLQYEEQARRACHDWRVAGKCMERMDVHFLLEPDIRGWAVETYSRDKQYKNRKYRHFVVNKSLPLAIIQAFVHANDD